MGNPVRNRSELAGGRARQVLALKRWTFLNVASVIPATAAWIRQSVTAQSQHSPVTVTVTALSQHSPVTLDTAINRAQAKGESGDGGEGEGEGERARVRERG